MLVIVGVASGLRGYQKVVQAQSPRNQEVMMSKICSWALFLCLMSCLALGQSFDGPAELPRVFLNTSLANTPAPGKIMSVPAGGSFRSAVNSANCGDIIQLAAGASYSSVSLPAKSCDDLHWIWIETSAVSSLPPEGTRATPCLAGVASLPGRPAYSCPKPSHVMAKLLYTGTNGSGPVMLATGANHYRLIGLEVTRKSNGAYVGELSGSLKGAADHFIVDRSWWHGDTVDDTGAGLNLTNLTTAAVVDSYFSDFHCTSAVGSCTDAKTIGGGGGTLPGGPYRIHDNFLEAAGENILFGGGFATTTPADIEITQNHMFKPMIWEKGQPGFQGGKGGNPFIVKNDFELKNAQRVLLEGNIFENCWPGFTQNGFAILLTPKNQAGPNHTNLCPLCMVTDVTIRYSVTHNTTAGMQIGNSVSSNGGAASEGGRYSIHDVTMDGVAPQPTGGGTLFEFFTDWPSHNLHDVTVNHITVGFKNTHLMTIGAPAGTVITNFNSTNSIAMAGKYPIWNAIGLGNCQLDDVPIDMFNSCIVPYSFDFNAVIAPGNNYPPSKWPAGDFFPADIAAVGFTNFGGGNYQLLPTSPYHNAGSDGKDLGADIPAINAAIANVN